MLTGCDSDGRKHFSAIDEGLRAPTEGWSKPLPKMRGHIRNKPPKLRGF